MNLEKCARHLAKNLQPFSSNYITACWHHFSRGVDVIYSGDNVDGLSNLDVLKMSKNQKRLKDYSCSNISIVITPCS